MLLALLLAQPVIAQDTPPWEPLGQMPVDQAGAGRRGYALAGESANVAEPGAMQVSLHMVAANNVYREQAGDFLITERGETHTLALGFRRGMKLRIFPRLEFGGQIQLHERDAGFLNGFISGFEDLWVSLTGSSSAKNQLRANGAVLPPLGTVVMNRDQLSYQATGDGSGLGDISLVAKAVLRDGAPASRDTRVAARVAVNLSGVSDFTEGNFAGFGVSLDKKLLKWAAFHGDVRATILLDRMSQWNLPLKRASFGFSAGPEFKLTGSSSLSFQYDGNTTPYLPAGAAAFDEGFGDITIGLSHRFRSGPNAFLAQVYARENLDLPLRVRWNTDPDLAVGIRIAHDFGSQRSR